MTAPINTSGDRVTLLKTINPKSVGKHYYRDTTGNLIKKGKANVVHGVGKTIEVSDASALVELLEDVTSSTDLCIVPGEFVDAGDEQFEVVSEADLARMTGFAAGKVAGGVHVVGERRVAARLKRGIRPSFWLLLDCDNPEGIPPEWAAMSIQQRLEFLEPLLPGISRCERVELRGSSARVANAAGPGAKSHAWVRVTHPELIEAAKACVRVRMVNLGLSFPSPRFSKKEPSNVIGHEPRTVVDLSVWDIGRIVFNARPTLGERMDGYTVADPGIVVVNEDAGPLDLSWAVSLPGQHELEVHTRKTGQELRLRSSNENGTVALHIEQTNALAADTEITHRGVTKTLGEWVATMKPGDKLRCEAPFRFSESEAAFIRVTDQGQVLVHDVGNRTTYYPSVAVQAELARSLLPVAGAPVNIALTPISPNELETARLTPRVIVPGLLYADVRIRIAAGGVGKTTLALYEAVRLALGLSIWDKSPEHPIKTVLVTREDSREILVARLRELMRAMALSNAEVVEALAHINVIDLSDEAYRLCVVDEDVVKPHLSNMQRLVTALAAWEPDWVIFDPLVSFGVGESRVNDAEQGMIEAFRIIRNRLNCCVEGIHHSGKANAREKTLDQYSGRGGSALADGARMVAVLQPLDPGEWRAATGNILRPDETGLVMALPKMSYTKPQDPLFIRRDGYWFTVQSATKQSPGQQAADRTEKVLTFISTEWRQGRRYNAADLENSRDSLGLSRQQIRAAVTALKVAGRIVYNEVKGKAGSHFEPVCSVPTLADGDGDTSQENQEMELA